MQVQSSIGSAGSASALVVGVCGHRDLQPHGAARAAEQIARFLDEVQQLAPDTELRLMTAMAHGADLLAAQAALAAGWRVDAVLPMPLAAYDADFDPASRTLLASILAHPAVRCSVLDSGERDPTLSCRAQRERLYERAAEVIIQRCAVLIAVWDGVSPSLPGGTTDTVLKYLDAQSQRSQPGGARIEIRDACEAPMPDDRFAYWTPVQRSDDDAAPRAQAPRYLTGLGDGVLAASARMPMILRKRVIELNAYNRECARLNADAKYAPRDSLQAAFIDSMTGSERAALERIDHEYGKADALALHFQRRANAAFRGLGVLAGVLALLFLVYAKLSAAPWLLWSYVSAFALSLGLFYWIKGRRWFANHLAYRVLAETLRTRFFLRAVNAEREVDAAHLMSLTGVDHFPGFSWITLLLQNIEPLTFHRPAGATQNSGPALESVRLHWIRHAQSYFRRRILKMERSQGRLLQLKNTTLLIVFALAVGLLIFGGAMQHYELGDVHAKDAIVFTMALLPVLFGVWELYQSKMATRELLWQYRNQLDHFTRAEARLARRPLPEQARQILAELGMESLMETYLWTIHRYHREVEPPTAAG